MTKTQSEILFERFCLNMHVAFSPVREQITKTPDYVLTINDQRIIVGVKEITPNKEEKESTQVRKERGYGNVITATPGDRIRKKISDSSPQIKARTQGKYPSVLVLFDDRPLSDHLSEYNVKIVMYGLAQIYIAVPTDPSMSPYTTGTSFGPKRKMTAEHNTSISAIGVLFRNPELNMPALKVYHNKYAAVPLDPQLLEKHKIPQFKLGDKIAGKTADWEKIVA